MRQLRRSKVRNLNQEFFAQLEQYDEERLGKLFDELDHNQDGRIDVQDIVRIFSHVPEEHIKVV